MEIRNKIKSALPHIIAVLFFAIISFVYYYPVLEGKIIKANDSSVSRYNSKEISDYRQTFGKEPLWTNSIFSGMPAYLILIKHPGNLMKSVDTVLRQFGMPVSVLFLSLLGFYILLLIFKVNPWLALAGSLAYGFSSFTFQILAAGHNTQAIALAYLAPVAGGIYYAYRHDAIKGALFTAVALSLELVANHPQITYYGIMCLFVFVITEFVYSIKEKTITKFIKTSLILIIPFIIAVGINFGNLFTIYEYGKYSIRSKSELVMDNKNVSSGLDRDYIVNWSYGIDETFNLLIPDYKGGSSQPFDRNSETVKTLRQNNAGGYATSIMKYWGTQPVTDGPHYVGAIMVFLFVFGLLVVKGREKWWLLIATLLSIMLSWGRNFMPFTNLFIDFFPGYNKFRAVTMILVITQFCIPLLGILALRDIYNGSVSKKDILKNLKIAAGITGGFVVLVLLMPGIAGSFINQQYEFSFPDWLKTALITDRKDLLRLDAFRSLIFILLATGTILGFIYEKLRKEYFIIVLGALILFDLWSVDKRYLNADRFERLSAIQKSISPTFADQYILKDKSYYRVLNLAAPIFNDNTPTSYFHKSIGGYHGAKMRRYQELIDSSLSRNIDLFATVLNKAKSEDELDSVFNNVPSLNMLNAKYIIYNPEAPPIVNPKALGNAWFVEKPVIVNNANEEISKVNTINPSTEAVIDKRFGDQITGTSYPVETGEKIELTSYQPNELIYKSSARTEKLAVFSDIYYPAGWKCFVDGTASKYFRANYVLRAMIVPPGDHEIKFIFEPSSYYTGNKVSLASSILLFILLTGYFGIELRKRMTR
jgi:hypothetical protein